MHSRFVWIAVAAFLWPFLFVALNVVMSYEASGADVVPHAVWLLDAVILIALVGSFIAVLHLLFGHESEDEPMKQPIAPV